MTTKVRPGVRAGRPVERASTIPALWYFDPDRNRREIDRIFARTWQQVAREDQLRRPGDYATAEAAGEPLLIVRGRDDTIRAFYNVCRHRAGTVAAGEGCLKAFSCTYHGWTYALDGRLLAAPEMDGVEEFEPARLGLVPVRCASWGGLVFVNLDPDAPPLERALGALAERSARTSFATMRFARRDVYDIACNWKVYVDNYLEGYHVPRAHPGLNRVLDYRRYTVETDDPVVVQSSPARGGGPGHDERYLYVWVWPNFMLNVSPEYAQTNVVVPAGPERTTCVFDYFFPEGSGRARRRETTIAWSDGIQQEDVRICEAVQRNLRSRSYSTGRYSAKRENGVWFFHEKLRRALAARGATASRLNP